MNEQLAAGRRRSPVFFAAILMGVLALAVQIFACVMIYRYGDLRVEWDGRMRASMANGW